MSYDRTARERHRRNVTSRTNRPLDKEAEKLGIAGEVAFARLIGKTNYVPTAKGRTPGYQFTVAGFTVKVQTSRTPGNLLVKTGKVAADIYVLAGCHGAPEPEHVFWCGWTHASTVRQAEVRTMTDKGDYALPSHTIPRDELNEMGSLLALLGVPRENLRPAKTPEPPEKEDRATSETIEAVPLFDLGSVRHRDE